MTRRIDQCLAGFLHDHGGHASLILLPFVTLLAGLPLHAQVVKDHGKYDDTFRKYSKRFFGPGYDWQHFKAQGLAESNLRPAARSHVGARGVMQLMPGTYAELRRGNRELGGIDDPEWNIAAGIMYDRRMWEAWDTIDADLERRRFMFASYNAGPGNIRRAARAADAARLSPHEWSSIEKIARTVRRWRSTETIGYVRKIENFYHELTPREAPPSRRKTIRVASTKVEVREAVALQRACADSGRVVSPFQLSPAC